MGLAFLGLIIITSWWFISNNERASAHPEEGVIDVWVTWGDNPATLQAFFDRYDQPVRVRTGLKYDRAMKALAGSNPPDLMILSTREPVQWAYEEGLILPVDTLNAAERIAMADFFPALLAPCAAPDGRTTCMPLGGSVDLLYWNKDLFEAAGLAPDQPPRTMEELVSYADQLTIRDEAGDLTQIGFVPDFPRSHLDLYARDFGGSPVAAGGVDLPADSQPVVDAMNWQLQFYGLYSPAEAQDFLSALTPYTPQTASGHPRFAGRRLSCQQCHHLAPARQDKLPDLGFYSGHVAMIVDGQWQMGPNAVSHFHPDLNYGVAPLPAPTDHPERAGTTLAQGPVAVLPTGGHDQEATAELVAWMTAPDNQADFAAIHTLLPVSRAAAEDERFAQSPHFTMAIGLLAQSNASYRAPSSLAPELNDAWREAEGEILHEEGDLTCVLDALRSESTP